jgi:hypothetical protein
MVRANYIWPLITLRDHDKRSPSLLRPTWLVRGTPEPRVHGATVAVVPSCAGWRRFVRVIPVLISCGNRRWAALVSTREEPLPGRIVHHDCDAARHTVLVSSLLAVSCGMWPYGCDAARHGQVPAPPG